MTKMAAMAIYGKNPFKNLLQNQKPDDLWDFVCSIGDVGPTKFVQMIILGSTDVVPPR